MIWLVLFFTGILGMIFLKWSVDGFFKIERGKFSDLTLLEIFSIFMLQATGLVCLLIFFDEYWKPTLELPEFLKKITDFKPFKYRISIERKGE